MMRSIDSSSLTIRFNMVAIWLIAALSFGAVPLSAAPFELKPKDHVVYLGNATADRMQFHGHLETAVQAALPKHELVFRNHGFAGDTVTQRPRSKGFPNPDWYLKHSGATVIFAFFGYNESHENKPEQFKKQLAQWIDHTRKQNYSGEGAPRIVLFSPIGHENLHDPNLPDGSESNARLQAYTAAMQQIAKDKKVTFVDLYHPTLKLYEQHDEPLTINGIHLTREGNRLLAEVVMRDLLKLDVPASARTEKLRQAVLDKNWHWFNRYRATDGNDIWGGRSGLKFTDGQTNRDVLQHELEMIDVMVANRDKKIWAISRGSEHVVDDSNVPPPVEVKTNFGSKRLKKQGGKSKQGELEYLSPTETLSKMKLADGLQANVFASEKMFPQLANPVQMSVDTKGRVWVAAWKDYPKWEPLKEMRDRLLILPDEDRDGVADKAIEFAAIQNPTAFEFWNGGVLVASAPDIWFLKDTDGDDKADVKIRILHGIDSADTHHAANNFAFGPDGHIYYQRGVFHVSNVETPWAPPHKSTSTGMYRFNPRTFRFAFHAGNGPNPHGSGFDKWGYHYATDGTTGRAWQVLPHNNGFKMHKLFNKTVRPIASSEVISSDHLPDEFENNYTLSNTIAFLGVKRYKLNYNHDNNRVQGEELPDLITCTDGNFRPTDLVVGDDGAVYISDWQNALIGHMQHNIRDPNRDHKHGRVYRITAKGRPLSKHVPIDGEPIEKLLDNLKHPVNNVRYRTRIELSERDPQAVMTALGKWIKQFDASKKEHAHPLVEALWLHQQFNVANDELLKALLESPHPKARYAAGVVKHFWSLDPAEPFDPEPMEEPEPEMTPDKQLLARGFSRQNLAQYKLGAEVYMREAHCGTCHQIDGKGLDKQYPPLTDSQWVQGDPERLIKISLKGLWGELTVKGKTYNAPGTAPTPPMTGFGAILKDHELAAVLTYVRNTFDNNATPITPEQVAKVRKATESRNVFYMVDDILKENPFQDNELKNNKN